VVFQTYNPRLSDTWTEERIILLLKLDAENKLSRSQIANEMHRQTGSAFSRNAIIGKLARLGVPRKQRPEINMILVRVRNARPKTISGPPKPLPQPAIILQTSLMLSMDDLTPTTCRYPTSPSGLPIAFCGHEIARSSYCAAHYRICYNSPRDPRPDASIRMKIMNARRYREELLKKVLKPACEAA